MQSVILAIDEGTTNAKAVYMDKKGQIIAKASQRLCVYHPKPAWSEQDPMEIIEAVRMAVMELPHKNIEIAAIGISNQRESVLIWDKKTGQALTPVAVWQCRRSQAFCQELAQSQAAQIIQEKTGLPIDPLFPAAKIRCLLDGLDNGHIRAKKGEICAGTIDSWLLWNLSQGRAFATDVSNASRTQLFNIHSQSWDESLAQIFGIPMECLPQIAPSSGFFGETLGFEGIADGIPILSQIGDSHGALYGQGGFMAGVVKATYGTGSSLMTSISKPRPSDEGLAQTVAWNDGGLTYALEGNITHTGSGVDYMRKLLNIKDIDTLTRLAQSVETNNNVYFVPALSGLGAPYWQSQASGLITGLTDNATAAHLARAALEAVAYQVADVFYGMEKAAKEKLHQLLVDGGPTKNTWLMQFQANVINRPIIRSHIAEVSALGAGYLAGKSLGWWQSREDLAKLERHIEVIHPHQHTQNIQENYKQWQKAIMQTMAGL